MSRLARSHPPLAVSGSDCVAPAIGELTAWFARWFEQPGGGESLWPAFDRWVRDSLHQFLGARRVRCFRVTESSQRLTSLASELDDVFLAGLSSHGLIDHVVASGRRYVRDAPGNGELIERLAHEWAAGIEGPANAAGLARAPDWLVPVRGRNRTNGLILICELPEEKRRDLVMLQAVGHLLELFWNHVGQAQALAIARRTDQASGVLNRIDLNSLAEKVLHESAADGEPIVVLALAVEGVRRLDDQGQWQLRDWLMKQIGLEMRRKLRSDDLVGRFSDDRFVAVLRRLDMSLGQLIAKKVLQAVQARISRQAIVHEMVNLRCGLAESSSAGFEQVLVCAFSALEQARVEQRAVVPASTHGPRDPNPDREDQP